MTSRITINGKTIVMRGGSNISIVNGKVIVDGKALEVDTSEYRTVNVSIEGDVGSLQIDCGDIDITGNVTGDVSTGQGDISCGNVGRNVKTAMGSITCGSVGGDATTAMGRVSVRK